MSKLICEYPGCEQWSGAHKYCMYHIDPLRRYNERDAQMEFPFMQDEKLKLSPTEKAEVARQLADAGQKIGHAKAWCVKCKKYGHLEIDCPPWSIIQNEDGICTACNYEGNVSIDRKLCLKCLTKEQRAQFVKEETPSDPVNHPAHYKQGGMEAIDVIEAFQLDYYLGNTFNYISRSGKKDPAKEVEDLKKARWYLTRKIERLGHK